MLAVFFLDFFVWIFFENNVYLFMATYQARKFGGCQHKNLSQQCKWLYAASVVALRRASRD